MLLKWMLNSSVEKGNELGCVETQIGQRRVRLVAE